MFPDQGGTRSAVFFESPSLCEDKRPGVTQPLSPLFTYLPSTQSLTFDSSFFYYF